jgi:hypothetical protein
VRSVHVRERISNWMLALVADPGLDMLGGGAAVRSNSERLNSSKGMG